MGLMRYLSIVLVFALASIACADTGGEIADDINNVICLFVRLIWLVTGSLMALVIIFAGVKWLVSGEDAGARASAKTFIISAFVGLIIIFTAVPVVDYLVGGILGYEFACGFFPEVDSSVLDDGLDTKLTTLAVEDVDPLAPSGVAVLDLGVPVLSRSVSGSGDFFACFSVSNRGGYPADISDLAADLYKEASLVSSGDCSCGEDLLDVGSSVEVVCYLGSGISGGSQGYVLYVRAGDEESSTQLSGLSVDPGCGVRLVVKSSDDNPVARIKVGDLDYSDSGEVVRGSSQLVLFHVLWSGESADYSWSIHLDGVKVTIPQNLGDKFNKQFLGLNSDEIEDVFKAPGSYTISVDVVGKDSEKKYPANTVTLNVVSASEVVVPVTADAKVGVIRGDEPAEFGKSARAKPGEKVVLKAENAKGTGTLKFLWKFNGKEYDKQLQPLFDPNTGENFLPTDPAVYPVHLTVTDELGKTYTEDVSIEILPEDAKPTISIKLGADEGGDDDFDGDCRVWLDIDYFDKSLWRVCEVKFTDHLGYREISPRKSPIQFEFTKDGTYTVKVRCLGEERYLMFMPGFAFYDSLPFGGAIVTYGNDPSQYFYSAEDTITVSGCTGKLPSLKPGPDEFAGLCSDVPGCTFFDSSEGPSTWWCVATNCVNECGSRGMTACHAGSHPEDSGRCLTGVSSHGKTLWWVGCCCR